MTLLVVDASAIGPLVLPDERENLIAGLFEELAAGNAVVPGNWRLEVANLARVAVRRRRIEAERLPRIFSRLKKLAVEVDVETDAAAWNASLDLAGQHDLTAYDAAYLELAMRRRLPLATLDGPLSRAALAENVSLFGR